MLEERTVLEQVEARRDGVVIVQLARQVLKGGAPVASIAHRFPINPGESVEEIVAAQDAWLVEQGDPALDRADWDRVRAQIALTQTPEVIAAFKAKQQAEAEEHAAQEAAMRAEGE